MKVTKEETTLLLWVLKTTAKGSNLASCIDAIPNSQRRLALGFFLSMAAGLLSSITKSNNTNLDEVIDRLFVDIFKDKG